MRPRPILAAILTASALTVALPARSQETPYAGAAPACEAVAADETAGAPVPYSQAAAADGLYTLPPVRPYEPPSDFGLDDEQGDAAPAGLRAPMILPVTVDAYRGQYEHQPTPAETAYQQGVAEAELRADAMMGAWDGRWRALDETGRPVLDLDIRDPGDPGRIEGAWRDPAAAPSRIGLVSEAVRDGSGGLALTLDSGAVLHLVARPQGLAGELRTGAEGRPVSLVPAG